MISRQMLSHARRGVWLSTARGFDTGMLGMMIDASPSMASSSTIAYQNGAVPVYDSVMDISNQKRGISTLIQKYGCVDGTLVNGTSQPHMFRGISTSKGESSMPRDSSTSGSSATTHQEVMPHPGIQRDSDEKGDGKGHTSYMLMHPVYEKEYVESIKPFHRQPKTFHDYTGYYGVQILRKTFDLITGYGNNMTADKWLTRFLFLETVAGVPGMVGAMLRHLRSLRTMRRDNGWIHTLLEEAENERMHLLTFMQMRNPGFFFRTSVIGTQGIFLSFYTLFYAISPRHCHAFVSYLEEEAVKTYTHAISDLDSGKVPEWKNMVAPDIACKYWRLEKGASMRDLLLAVRADEVCHNHVNAVFAEMKADDPNPFAPGTTVVQ